MENEKEKVQQIKILDVKFLTAAKVTIDGHGVDVSVFVDLANRKVYDKNMHLASANFGEKFFEYLDATTILPDDFFAASDDIQEKAHQAYEEVQKHKEEHLGGVDGWGSTTD